MTTFETDGFLSDEIAGFESDIATRYSKRIDLAGEANQLTHHTLYSAKIYNQQLIDLLLAALLTRQAGSFQGFIILLRKGLLIQAQTLLRNLAETMFLVGAIRKDKTFAKSYVVSDEVARKKSLEALMRDQQRRGVKVDGRAKALVAELDAKIKNEKITKLPSAEEIARIAGLSSYYDTLYRFTSMAVHTSIRGLDKVLEVDAKGNVVSLNYGPAVADLEMYFDYGISMMLYTLHEIASHFELPVNDIESLQQRNNEQAGPSDIPVVAPT